MFTQVPFCLWIRLYLRPCHGSILSRHSIESDDLDFVHWLLPYPSGVPLALSIAAMARVRKSARRCAGLDILRSFKWSLRQMRHDGGVVQYRAKLKRLNYIYRYD